MPKEVIIECDRCGKKINVKTDLYSYIICANRAINTTTTVHLCQTCYDGLTDYLENFMQEDINE